MAFHDLNPGQILEGELYTYVATNPGAPVSETHTFIDITTTNKFFTNFILLVNIAVTGSYGNFEINAGMDNIRINSDWGALGQMQSPGSYVGFPFYISTVQIQYAMLPFNFLEITFDESSGSQGNLTVKAMYRI